MRKPLGLVLSIGLVLALSGIALGQTASQSMAPPKVSAPDKMRPSVPDTYGLSQTSYYQVPSAAFLPFDSSRAYTTTGFGVFSLGRYATGSGTDFNAPAQLPSGALITYLELDYCDTDPGTNYVFGSFMVCNFQGSSCTNYPTSGTSAPGFLTSHDGSRTGCSEVSIDMTPFNITVDNYFTHYALDAETNATDGSNSFSGMLIGYKLQVSPAPGTATFLDVPTSSPQFQFVEALVAAGITVGCGGNNYCPNTPVTRGQMAVFISKALGLQWTQH